MIDTKKCYFENLDTKKNTDNGSFWRTVLLLFAQNSSKAEKRNLVDGGKTISSDEEPCEIFDKFFSNIVLSLNIAKPKSFPMASKNLDPIMSVIKSFDKRQGIVKTKTKALKQPSISEKLTTVKLKRLSVFLTLKSLTNKKYPH